MGGGVKTTQPAPLKRWERAAMKKVFGGVLLSHTASRAVPSALKSLTSVFGMGTGVASSPSPPKNWSTGFTIKFLDCVIGRRSIKNTASSRWPCQKHYPKADNIGAIWNVESVLNYLCQLFCGQASRLISTSKLNTLLCLHTWPINLVVFEESSVKHVSTLKGYLISRWASRLDAFSGYPFRT